MECRTQAFSQGARSATLKSKSVIPISGVSLFIMNVAPRSDKKQTKMPKSFSSVPYAKR